MARILVTDDAAFMRMQLKDILTKLGHEVVGEAENGEVSVQKYEELRPDLVTMDITMPEMNGIEAVKSIKKNHPTSWMLSEGRSYKLGMVLDAIRAGAKDFLVKPFTKERIEEALVKLF